MQAPTPTTLRITGGGQGGAEPPRAQGHTFKLTAEEVRVEPDTVASMVSFRCCLVILLFCGVVFYSSFCVFHGLVEVIVVRSCKWLASKGLMVRIWLYGLVVGYSNCD